MDALEKVDAFGYYGCLDVEDVFAMQVALLFHDVGRRHEGDAQHGDSGEKGGAGGGGGGGGELPESSPSSKDPREASLEALRQYREVSE